MSPLALDAAQDEMDREFANVSNASVGRRHRTLNAAAYNLGQLVGAGLLSEAVVARRLRTAIRNGGFHPGDWEFADQVIARGLAAGIARPVEVYVDSAKPAGRRPAQAKGSPRSPRQPSPDKAAAPSEPLTGRQRKRCGARARSRGGAPCQCKVVPGRTRCKLHGGMSTGPKTPEGRARSSEGARRYHAERRVAQEVNAEAL